MTANTLGRRHPLRRNPVDLGQFQQWIAEDLRLEKWFPLFDLLEEGVERFPQQAVAILALAHDAYQILRKSHSDRYHLYQGRLFEFRIDAGETVLDLGSGHHPFPLATHLSDISVEDASIGRAGIRFENPKNLPVFEFPVERIPLADGEVDFVYCSHVLEHSTNPVRACSEIQRIARRGYIETPAFHKDLWMCTARVSNHTMAVDWIDEALDFRPYRTEELDGLGCDIVSSMANGPQTDREKALSALIYLKADRVNTMVYWERGFRYKVNGKNSPTSSASPQTSSRIDKPKSGDSRPLFVQVHTFYGAYLEDFHRRHPRQPGQGHAEVIRHLLADGFSQIHMFAPAMEREGFRGMLIIPNDPVSQSLWWTENVKGDVPTGADAQSIILKTQIEFLAPEILYIADPIAYQRRFLESLTHRPRIIMGWRAADIPEGVDWTGFDIILSGLKGVRDHALKLGARAAVHFYPGFAAEALQERVDGPATTDVIFCGSVNPSQHIVRGQALCELLDASKASQGGFSLALHLNAPPGTLSPALQQVNRGPLFGVEMYRATRRAKMTVDIRGNIRCGQTNDPTLHAKTDLARNETMNMRIFEATGCGIFLLTEHYDNLEEYFRAGWEIETFRSREEMLDKIRFYLRRDDLREAIARRGQERCLREHSMEARCRALAQILRTGSGESEGRHVG